MTSFWRGPVLSAALLSPLRKAAGLEPLAALLALSPVVRAELGIRKRQKSPLTHFESYDYS
jgi:hypothetical protein